MVIAEALVDFGQEPPAGDLCMSQVGDPGNRADDVGPHAAVLVSHGAWNAPLGHDHVDVGQGALDSLGVHVGQPVLDGKAALAGARGVGGLDAPQDDVGRPQAAELLLGLQAGPFADGQHGDHGADAAQDAQHGQQRPQGMLLQASQAESDDFKALVGQHGSCGVTPWPPAPAARLIVP